MIADVPCDAVTGDAADARADDLDADHQRRREKHAPQQAEAELRARLRIRRNAARVVVGGAGDETGAEPLEEILEALDHVCRRPRSVISSAYSTGLTRCPSNPASCDLRRSSSCPQPVSAITSTELPHGAYCVGCCLPLFAVLLVVGLMNLFWMVALFLIVLVERNWKHGLTVARAAGAVLIVLGIAMAAWPAVLFVVSGT